MLYRFKKGDLNHFVSSYVPQESVNRHYFDFRLYSNLSLILGMESLDF